MGRCTALLCKRIPIPIIPINITVGSTSSAIDKLPAVGCSVNNRVDNVEPALTETGVLLKSIIDSEANPSLLGSMVSVKGMKDTTAMICLMETIRRTGFVPMTDTAPLVRLGMLMHCIAPTEWMAYVTSKVQNVCANGYADVTGTKRTWQLVLANFTGELLHNIIG